MVVLAQMKKLLFLWWGLPYTSFLWPLMPLLGLHFLQNPFQTNTWPQCCLVTVFTGTNPLFLSCDLSPTVIPFINNINFLTNPPSTPSGACASLEVDPCLEGNVADGEVDPLAWPGISFALFSRDSWLHGPTTFDQTCWTFLRSFGHNGYTVVANMACWRVAGDLVPHEAPDYLWFWVIVYL